MKKVCFVPCCQNTSVSAPVKAFIFIPRSQDVRNSWFQAAGIHDFPSSTAAHKYCCEDHFNNPGDVGTVGAVAIDANGRLAAATSTGGINGKMVGRSSDTCMIGSGTYADDNVGAVSTTGHGETIAKFCLAHAIISEMRNGSSASAATTNSLKTMTARLNNTAGAITISKTGEVGVDFTSRRMAWAYRQKDEMVYGIERNTQQKEKVV